MNDLAWHYQKRKVCQIPDHILQRWKLWIRQVRPISQGITHSNRAGLQTALFYTKSNAGPSLRFGFSVCNEEVKPDGLWGPSGLRHSQTRISRVSILRDPLSLLPTVARLFLLRPNTWDWAQRIPRSATRGQWCAGSETTAEPRASWRSFHLNCQRKGKMISTAIQSPLSLLLHFT